MHRDISVGNIICDGILPSYTYVNIVKGQTDLRRKVGSQTFSLQKTDFSSPGMLIDFNLAVKQTREENASPGNPELTVCASFRALFLLFMTVSLQGVRTFMAIYILGPTRKHKWKRHSPIFDMESFFWILMFVPLYQGSKKKVLSTRKDKDNYRRLCPKGIRRDISEDADAKVAILAEQSAGPKQPESVLYPMKDLLHPLASLALRYYNLADDNSGSFDPSEEEKVLDEYIAIVEKFLCS